MDTIISFFSGIADAVTGFFSFLFSIVSDIVYLVQLTGKILLQIPAFFFWLPDQVLGLLVTILTIAVLYKVLGRD